MKVLIFILFSLLPASSVISQTYWKTISEFSVINNIAIENDSNYTIVWVPANGLGRYNFNTGTIWYSDTSSTTIPTYNVYHTSINNHIKWVGSDKGLYKFDNYNWTRYHPTNSGIPSQVIWDIDFDKSGAMWIATLQGLGRFYNNVWRTYNESNSPLPQNWLMSVAIINNEIWAGTFSSGVVRIIQNPKDTVWKIYNSVNSGLSYNYINDIEVKGEKVYIATDGGGVSVFNLQDSSWITYHFGYITSIAIDSNNTMWMGSPGGGLYQLKIGLDTNNFNPTNSPVQWGVNDIAIDSNQNIWIGDDAGLKIYNENGIVNVENIFTQIPEDFRVEKIYPNPFNPKTKIEFSVNKASDVQIKVYDIQGRLIKDVIYDRLNIGNHIYELEMNNHSSGIYFVSFYQNNTLVTSRKISLVK